MFALEELQQCLMKLPKQPELVVMHAFLKWSVTKMAEGYKLMWKAHEIDPQEPMVLLFVQLVQPRIASLYKDTQYMLIDGKVEKCNINIRKGLELDPHNTNLLIVKAYLHRTKEEYEQALCDLELANKTLKDPSLEVELRNQIALTYNEMGTFLYNKKKYTEAIALFNEGIAFKPSDWGMRANRGDCWKALNDLTKALEDYVGAHTISGDNEDVNFRLGSVFNSRGITFFNNRNPRQAVLEFTEALKYCKRCATFYVNRGKCLLELQKFPEAVSDFEAAAKH